MTYEPGRCAVQHFEPIIAHRHPVAELLGNDVYTIRQPETVSIRVTTENVGYAIKCTTFIQLMCNFNHITFSMQYTSTGRPVQGNAHDHTRGMMG